MAPKGKLTATQFQEQYGDLVSREHADCTTPRVLKVALAQRRPPILVTDGIQKDNDDDHSDDDDDVIPGV